MNVYDSSAARTAAVVVLWCAICGSVSAGQDSNSNSTARLRKGPPPEGYVEEVVPDEVGEAAARADEALMKELQREVEALPEELTHEVGVEILCSRVDEFQTVEARQRVLFSIANIYRQLGNREEAKRYYEEVVSMPSFDPHYSSMAKRELASMLAGEGRTDDALEVLKEDSSTRTHATEPDVQANASATAYPAQRKPGIDDDFMTLLAEAEVLQRADRVEDSLEILARLEREYSSPMRIDLILPVVCISTTKAFMGGRHDDALRLHEQMVQKIPVLADHAGLQSNCVTYAVAGNNTELTVQLATDFVSRFPNHEDATGHLSTLAGIAAARGDKELAAEYYTKIINHPNATEGYVETAKYNLAQLTPGRAIRRPQSDSDQARGSSWSILIWIHVILVVVGIVVLMYRRRRSHV